MDMMEIRRRVLSFDGLPPEYQRVEYIKSTGTQYLVITDTFYTEKKIYIVCQSDNVTSTQVIFGYGAGGAKWFGTVNGLYGVASQEVFRTVNINDKVTAVVQYSSNRERIDASIGAENRYSIAYGTIIRSLTLFGGKGSSQFYGCSAKVFSFRIEGICNLIPCYRKSDGTIGMYDTVTHRFLTNSGTGTFIKGNDV